MKGENSNQSDMRRIDLADSSRAIAGVLLFLLPVQFMTVLMAGAAIAPGYSINLNAISDLGVIGATAWLFNGSLFAAGLLNIAGGYFLYRYYGRGWILPVFALAGVGAMGAAVFTLDIPGIHGLFALMAFVFFNVEAIAGSTLVRGPLKAIAVIAGVLGLIFLVTHATSDFGILNLYGPIGHGGSERMIVYPALFWLAGFGGYLMAPGTRKR